MIKRNLTFQVSLFLLLFISLSRLPTSACREEEGELELELNFFEEDDDAELTTDPPEFVCPSDGAFPHPVNCELYYFCQNLDPYLAKCENNWLFDLRYMGCNYAEHTDCQNRTRPDGYPGTVTPPTPISSTTPGHPFDCPAEDGHYADPNDCSGYYQCSEGFPTRFQCPFPLRFDPELQVCNHPGFVDCGDRPTNFKN